jgi:hypothetical protein
MAERYAAQEAKLFRVTRVLRLVFEGQPFIMMTPAVLESHS